MRTTLFLSCLALSSCSILAMAAPAPKVIFVGDQFTYVWQQSAAFKANPNWIGAGTPTTYTYANSYAVAAAFPAVLNQHPDYVFLETGDADMAEGNSQGARQGLQFEGSAIPIIDIVQMAKRANVKIIIGTDGFGGGWLQDFANNENVPLVNFGGPLYAACPEGTRVLGQCPSLIDPNSSPADGGPFSITVPSVAGFQLITQMAQTAIATYSLKIKSGYLSDLETDSGGYGSDDYANTYPAVLTNVNTINPGGIIQFTPQATWTDGVTRPMLNVPISGVLGTWSSSNPKIAAVDRNGVVNAYSPGTAQIRFTSATGQVFSPWGITVVQWYAGEYDIPGPVY